MVLLALRISKVKDGLIGYAHFLDECSMPRPPPKPRTVLGQAIQARRGDTLEEAAAQSNIPRTTLSRLERGTHRPSYDTAKALASWLGWTVEQVMEGAERQVSTTQ